jgi:polysaccharide biosynthesis transport protein
MFFDDSTPQKSNLKPKLRLAGDVYGQDNATPITNGPAISARERLENARFQKGGTTSLLDRIDAITRAEEEAKITRQDTFSGATPEEMAARAALGEKVTRIAMGADVEPAAQEKQNHAPGDAADIKEKTVATSFTSDDPETDASYDGRQNWLTSEQQAAPLVHPVYVINAVRKWRYLIAATTILGGLIGIGTALTTPKLYSSVASIYIDPRNFKVIENDISPDVFLSEAAMAIVDSQINVMRSPVVMNEVAAKLILKSKPEFTGTKETWLSPLRKFFDVLSSDKLENLDASAVKTLYRKTEVSRQPGTFVFDIAAYSEDPQLAADIANTIVEVYFAERAGDRLDTAVRTSGSLKERLPDLKKQVEIAESKAAKFKAENDLFDPQGRSIGDEEILRLNDQLAAARSTTITLNARADSAKAVTVDGVLASGLPEEINSNALNALRAQYITAQQRYDGLQAKLGPMHPDLKQAGVESASLRTSLEAEIKRIRLAIQTDLRRAVQTEQALAARLAGMKAKLAESGDEVVQLREIEREAASARAVYEQYLQRSQETAEQATIDSTNAKRTILAQPSDEAVGTSRKLIAIVGVLGGFLLGLGLAIMSGVWDALKERYAGSLAGNRQLAPSPRPPFSPKPQTIRGTFQPRNYADQQQAATQNSASQQRSFVQANAPASAAMVSQESSPTVQLANVQQPHYSPMPVQPPVQMPVYLQPQPMFMPQFQPPWFVPQPAMMPHMIMPQPVQEAQYANPVAMPPQPLVQMETAAQAAKSRPANTDLTTADIRSKSLAPNAPLSDIQDSLADMKAELLNLARQRRQA